MNIKQAKNVKIEDLIPHQPSKVVGAEAWYLSPFREEKDPSFKLHREKNIWYDFAAGVGGDSLKYVQTLYKLDNVSQVLAKMDELVGSSPDSVFRTPKQAATKPKAQEPSAKVEITSIGPIKHPALISYVEQRGIDPKLASEYLQEIHYRRGGDKRFFAVALTNDAGLQTGVGFALRNERFKGNLGPADIRTFPGSAEYKSVAVYEGMFDFLSHKAIEPSDASAIVLNSAAMRHKAIAKIQSMQANEVDLYFDHDDTGRELVAFFRDALPGVRVHDRSGLYLGFHDLNEFHAAKSSLARNLPGPAQLRHVNRQLEKDGPSM